MHILVVQLYADHRPAVPEEQAFHLLADLAVQAAHQFEKAIVGAAHFEGLAVQPVGQAAVAGLAVGKGADPQDHVQPVPLTQRHEPVQVPPPGEVKRALCFLNVVPEHIGCDDIHPAHAHLDDGVLPPGGVEAAVVALPGYRQEGLSVALQIVVVEGEGRPVRGSAGKVRAKGVKRGGLNPADVDVVRHGGPSFLWKQGNGGDGREMPKLRAQGCIAALRPCYAGYLYPFAFNRW